MDTHLVERQLVRADAIGAEAEPALAQLLTDARVITGPSVAKTVSSWPWPSFRDAAVSADGPIPAGWEYAACDDWMRACVAANILHFSRGGAGLLYLADDAPLWSIDLDEYPTLLNSVLKLTDDTAEFRFAFVAEDTSAGILGSQCLASERGRPEDGAIVYELCCWGL